MKADPKAEAAAPKSSPKKMMVIAIIGALVLALAGGGAWFLTRPKGGETAEKEVKKAVKPEFVVIDQFTVNLVPEVGEQYLQINMTLDVAGLEQVQIIKDNMARVRSRILLLLSNKRASEINTVEGKKALAAEIVAAVNVPFADKGPKQEVNDVLFTSFIIQ